MRARKSWNDSQNPRKGSRKLAGFTGRSNPHMRPALDVAQALGF